MTHLYTLLFIAATHWNYVSLEKHAETIVCMFCTNLQMKSLEGFWNNGGPRKCAGLARAQYWLFVWLQLMLCVAVRCIPLSCRSASSGGCSRDCMHNIYNSQNYINAYAACFYPKWLACVPWESNPWPLHCLCKMHEQTLVMMVVMQSAWGLDYVMMNLV